MCIGNTTSPAASSNQTINWGRGPWDERPPIQMGEPSPDGVAKPKEKTNKRSLSLPKTPPSQSSKNPGLY